MMRKILLGFLSLLTLGQMALTALPVGAAATGEDPLTLLNQTGVGGTTSPDQAGKQLPVTVGKIIRVLMSILGVIFLVLIVYAGFLWMTARGEKDQVEKAKDIIKQGIIGLIIVFIAYALTGFIVSSILRATTGTT